jgi:choline dehydrogenase-like flavoprotein
MGPDRTAAVTDAFGAVHDADRLIVADASLFPTPIGVNPMETIMALATRAAAHVIDNARRFVS